MRIERNHWQLGLDFLTTAVDKINFQGRHLGSVCEVSDADAWCTSSVASACDVPSSLIERRFWTGAKPEEPEVWEVSFHFVD